MKALLATFLATFLLLVSAAAAAGPMVASDAEGTSITVYDEPCANEAVLARLVDINLLLVQGGLPPLVPEHLRRGVVVMGGLPLGACWVQLGDKVLVIDDGGVPERLFAAPVADFVPATEV